MTDRLIPACWTAALYAALGWISLRICIPPDYVSLVFLPAGLALGMVLARGPWMLPGVGLGSWLVQWLASSQAGLPDWSWNLLVSPIGAMLQAQVGAMLARRWVHYPDPVESPSRVMWLLMGVGPLSALINASLSVPVLVLSNAIASSEGLFSWWTWWLGDAVGSVLCLPLVLVLQGQPSSHWRNRRWTVAVPMLVALLLVGSVVYEIKAWEDRRIKTQLEEAATEMGQRLQRRLDAQSDSVQAIARVMQVSQTRVGAPQEITQEDFAKTARHWLERYSGTQNFGWSPYLNVHDRSLYEAKHWLIKGRSPTGTTYTSAVRSEYLPLTLIEPRANNVRALGLDVAVLPATAATVASSRASGQARVSEGIRLVQEAGEQRAVVMYQAVFEPQAPEQLKGVVSAVFRMDDVLQAMSQPDSGHRPESCLVDPQAEVDNQRLAGPLGCDRAQWMTHELSLRHPLRFGGREWELRVRATPAFMDSARDWSAWVIVALCLLCVGLLGAFLLVITGQARRTQALVDLRTRELAALAHYDSLTGLPNRSQWVSRSQTELEQAQRLGERLVVLFLDLDHFKHINDTLGHALGDELLQAVAKRLAPCLESHHLLARIGGDEFVVLMPRVEQPQEAAQVAEELRAALNTPLLVQGHEINLSMSMGIACYPEDGDTLDHLLKHADTAMYVAKEAGRNGYQFFMKEMNARVSRRMFLENNLRRALERNEMYLVYQPQIEASTGRVAGVEALVRWNHPEEGLIPPDRFIPVAEDCGLIEPLGAWVLHQACRQLQDWRDDGLDGLMMAINISPMQFRKPGFIDTVRSALNSSGVDPQRVELEITETLLMQPLNDLDSRLRELTAMGLTFALDDFGTGYSSLGYLKRLPISRIKLDKSFVADLPGDVEDEAVTRATLSMAKDLGLHCVAEGVETQAQRAFLTERGCDTLQGYLFARPMPEQECREWIRQYRYRQRSA
ncbi:bifunctional diguanylate cyclase/phosphodiesterase [Curvibacter microcysteis]|uniref:bifunctional diguanylate cyclase/phosphodiesterase n=1 Tax=Curvibacter microcysteis TaxID=3026419 RepID=UPI002360D192|nr:EAL domain-containing protein [Curvibacter sp. HBC28]